MLPSFPDGINALCVLVAGAGWRAGERGDVALGGSLLTVPGAAPQHQNSRALLQEREEAKGDLCFHAACLPTVKHNQVSDSFGLFMRQGGGPRGFVFKASGFIFVIKTLPPGLESPLLLIL